MTDRRDVMRRLLLAAVVAAASFAGAGGIVEAAPSGCTVSKGTYSIVAYCSGGVGNYWVAGYCRNSVPVYLYVTGPPHFPGTVASVKTCPSSHPFAQSAWVDW